MEHFSKRLGRNYHDDDWLIRDEVAEVLSVNAGRSIKPEYVTELARREILHPDRTAPRGLRYQYSEVKAYVVRSGPGRHVMDDPTPGALRKRKFVQRHGPKRDHHIFSGESYAKG